MGRGSPGTGRLLKIYVVETSRDRVRTRYATTKETTILQLLALSEGLAPYSAKVAYVYRRAPGGAKTEVPVELAKIMERKSPDVPLQANDILYIPDNKGRRLTAQAIDRLAGLGSAPPRITFIWH